MTSVLSWLRHFRKEPPTAPKLCETDEIVPVHLFDDSAAARSIVMVWTFKFDDVLDPQRLHAALCQLLQMDGWRRLSGRFRYKSNGMLEIHIPAHCSEERPAVFFTKEHHEGTMKSHPLASKLPQLDGRLATYPSPRELSFLGLTAETPRNMNDYAFSDKPQFCLYIQTFTDGTLVSITNSHVTTDAMGFASLLEAWSLILAGKAEEVKPMHGFREDPFEQLWKPKPDNRHVLADKILSGWRFKYWALRNFHDSWRSLDVSSRTLCIPKRLLDKMLSSARKEIESSFAQVPFISAGDVLTAVACRTFARYHGPHSNRRLATIMALDPRTRARSMFHADAAYVQNSPTNIFYFYDAKGTLDLPLGRVALSIRKAISTQAQEEELKAAAYLSVQSIRATRMPVIFGDKDMATQMTSNWTKCNLAKKMDFGSAVVRDGDATTRSRHSKRGHPVYYTASDPAETRISVISNLFVVMGTDFDGNTWLSINFPGKMWKDMLGYLEQFE